MINVFLNSNGKGLFLKFQFFVLRLKFDNFPFLLQRFILKLEHFILKSVNLYLKLCNFSLKRYYRLWFGVRAFYYFAFHGVLLDQELDFLYDDTHNSVNKRKTFHILPIYDGKYFHILLYYQENAEKTLLNFPCFDDIDCYHGNQE